MQEAMKKTLSKLLIPALVLVLVVSLVVIYVVTRPAPSLDYEVPGDVVGEVAEDPTVPLATDYIVLSYPAELESEAKVTYEHIADGQKITFTTGFTGEEVELFSFTMNASGAEGYQLGTLQHETGELIVTVNVQEYLDGNWKPEDYNKITELQSRVNDIITLFYEDPRFVPNR